MMHRILYKLSILSLVFTVITVVYLAYVQIIQSNDFYLTEPVTIDSTNIKRGDILPVNFSFCKKTGKQATISYQLVNGQVINLSQVNIVEADKCNKKSDFVEIPHTIPPSNYKLIINVSYERSVFKTEHYKYETPTFNIK